MVQKIDGKAPVRAPPHHVILQSFRETPAPYPQLDYLFTTPNGNYAVNEFDDDNHYNDYDHNGDDNHKWWWLPPTYMWGMSLTDGHAPPALPTHSPLTVPAPDHSNIKMMVVVSFLYLSYFFCILVHCFRYICYMFILSSSDRTCSWPFKHQDDGWDGDHIFIIFDLFFEYLFSVFVIFFIMKLKFLSSQITRRQFEKSFENLHWRKTQNAKNAFNSFIGHVFANLRQKTLFLRVLPKLQQKRSFCAWIWTKGDCLAFKAQ